MKSEMVNWLREYLRDTPAEEVKKDWKEIEELGLRGPNAYDYLEFMSDSYCKVSYPPPREENEVDLISKMTPEFSESFFFA